MWGKQKNIMDTLRRLLDYKKIEINRNNRPIPMDLFLSFITIDTVISRDHLGSNNGWTRRVNDELNLIIGGGIVNGVNYLDSIQYMVKLGNPYNNYVNPFYLFDLMTNEGKMFFINYYKDDIEKIISDKQDSIDFLKQKIKKEEDELTMFINEYKIF